MTPEFDRVYRDERPGLTRLAFLMVGSTAVAEELVQDAFTTLYENLGRVRNPGGFVRTTLVRRCLTHEGRRRMEHDRLAEIDEPPPTGDHEIDETWAVLDRLDPERRAVLVLRYYADLDYAAIGETLGIETATARTRAHRGLADLREELER
jgi:RNA polymerase sigma factor (sigma-70 family)